MPYFAVDDLVELTIYTRFRSQNGLMVSHLRAFGNSGTGATPGQTADGIDALIATAMKDMINVAATYLGVSIQRLLPAPKSDKFYGTANAGIGNREDDVLVSQACGLLSVRTGLAGRAHRGRKYFPFPSETDNDPEGKPTGSYLTRMTAVGTLIFNQVVVGAGANTTEFTPVVYSRRTNFLTPVTGIIPRREWGTQRRRSQVNRGDLPPTP